MQTLFALREVLLFLRIGHSAKFMWFNYLSSEMFYEDAKNNEAFM